MTKFIVVTGASKGIGRAAADASAGSGWSVLGVARHEPDSFPGQFMTADLSDVDATAEVASRLAHRGDVLGIVNNVGASRHEHFESVEPRTFFELMKVNVEPALQLSQAVLPAMRKARFGRIISITSLVTRGLPFRTSYAAAKSALESLTRTMAIELAPDGNSKCSCTRSNRNGTLPRQQPTRKRKRETVSLQSPHGPFRTTGGNRSSRRLSCHRQRRIHNRTDSVCRRRF